MNFMTPYRGHCCTFTNPQRVEQGKFAEAEPLLRRSLAIQEQKLGPDHPEVATTLHNLAHLLAKQVSFSDVELP